MLKSHKTVLLSSMGVLLLTLVGGLAGWFLLRPRAGWGLLALVLLIQSAVLAAAEYALLYKLVAVRLASIRMALTSISDSGDCSSRLAGEGPDEIGQLTIAINGVLAAHESNHRELRVAHDTLLFRAAHDPITGLSNRSAVMAALARELARASREHKSLAVLLIDVDHFKQVNDQYGPTAGDAILRALGARLQGSVRPYDHVGRYGNDEFLVVVPGCQATEAHRLARRIREAVRGAFSKAAVPVTVSIGLTVATGEEQAATVVAIADSAMYRAKQAGCDRVEFAAVSPSGTRKGQPAWTV